MSKYDSLTAALSKRPEPEVILSFEELDGIVGGLPASARTYREWWTNRASSQPHSVGWLAAGRMATPDFERGVAVFRLDADLAAERRDLSASPGIRSPSGVWIADDFRSNLIIDRFDPAFASMRASKLKHLRSENSEDAATWNAFRSLRQVDPALWLPGLWRQAFPDQPIPDTADVVVSTWPQFPPPPALRAAADEGLTEVDVVIEGPLWVWFIEAKLRSDISTGTTTRPDRDQILRNIDVGSYYSGVRAFYFSLLSSGSSRSPKGAERIGVYRDINTVREVLAPHRPDGLVNLGALGHLEWQQVGEVLASVARSSTREDERSIARRAANWLEEKGLWARDV